MPLFSDNPVLERELRGRLRLRRRGSPAGSWVAAGAVALAALYGYVRGMIGLAHGTQRDAQELWPYLVFGLLALITLLAPALSSTAISVEREQQTWETLEATLLSSRQVILGKWLGRQVIPGLLLLIALPFLVATEVKGLLGAPVLLLSLLFLAGTSLAFGLLGLFCSYRARRTMTATASSLTTLALLCIGTPVFEQILHSFFGAGQGNDTTPLMWINPFYALSALQGALLPESGGHDLNLAGMADGVLSVYALALALFSAGALYLMLRGYGRAARN